MNLAPMVVCIVFAALLLPGDVVRGVSDGTVSSDDIDPRVKTRPELKDIAREKAAVQQEGDTSQLNLPEDTSSQFAVRQLRISGNTLISTDELLKNMPLVYNTSDKPADQADPGDLYDLRTLHEVIAHPDQPHEVSRRAMRGFTQYILSVYQDRGYAGIYVYISAQAVPGGAEFQDGVLPIDIVEAIVSDVSITSYDPEGKPTEKEFLRSSFVKSWSPIKTGQIVKKNELDNFVNLLNLSPDRYVSAVISRGSEPDTLAVGYDIYEANPWHYYIQVDNSGITERQWAPRIGFINTNVTGRDDRLTAMLQGPVDKNPKHNHSYYLSYDLPLWTPRLRLNVYGGRSEFDIGGSGDIDFLGNGSFYGGMLRFNAFQKDEWFFDVTSSLSHEKSTVTTSLFPEFFGSEVEMDLWGLGLDIHRQNDMSSSSLVLERVQSIGGSSQKSFWDPSIGIGARTNAERDFSILTFSANHRRFLDQNKIQRFTGSFKYIRPDERLVPSKMTTFGGMYTVRGYEENKIVADGGILGSVQYEYDLIKHGESEETEGSEGIQKKKPWLRKLAPLVFFDYGRAQIKSAVAGENSVEELCSVGVGFLVDIGEHFNIGVYYGHPLRSTNDTKKSNGRLNVGLMMRW